MYASLFNIWVIHDNDPKIIYLSKNCHRLFYQQQINKHLYFFKYKNDDLLLYPI